MQQILRNRPEATPPHVQATAQPVGAASFVHPAGTSQVDVGAGAVVEQANVVVAGRVVQPQTAPVVCVTYFKVESPHSHQPVLSAIAAQVFCGSAACSQDTVAEATGD